MERSPDFAAIPRPSLAWSLTVTSSSTPAAFQRYVEKGDRVPWLSVLQLVGTALCPQESVQAARLESCIWPEMCVAAFVKAPASGAVRLIRGGSVST